MWIKLISSGKRTSWIGLLEWISNNKGISFSLYHYENPQENVNRTEMQILHASIILVQRIAQASSYTVVRPLKIPLE